MDYNAPKLRGQNENTTEPRKCIRNFVFRSHSGTDLLIVDTRGFNGKTWLDQTGKPTSDALHVTERFRRTDFGHMEIQITIDDPKVYTKPWQVKEQVRLVPNSDIIEAACENNRDIQHLGGKFSR